MKEIVSNLEPAKRTYSAPEIERVLLDNEISLILQSTGDLPPDDPE